MPSSSKAATPTSPIPKATTGIARAPDTNPVVAAARRAASQPLHYLRYRHICDRFAGDTARIRLIEANSAPAGLSPAARRTGR